MNRIFIALVSLSFSTLGLKAQLTEEWHTEYNGVGDFSDLYTCVDSDAEGSVYLGGSTIGVGQNSNYLITKLNNAGQIQWQHSYNAPGNGPDEIKDIQVKDDKVYVTGYGNNITVGNDFWTMCFTTGGDSLWANLYNDPVYNQYDQANSLFVGDDGSVYVTGESDSDITGAANDDFLTIKLSSTGSLDWAKRYAGPGIAIDRAYAVVADASGNAFVTGRGENLNDDDYVTIKYNSSGAEQWVQNYDNGGNDRAIDMGIDAAGNIYVTGKRNNGANDDYHTIKYNTSGGIVYSKTFDFVDDDRAESIAVNADGSFAVTGRSDANATAILNWNYYTVKYDISGNQLWTASYNGTANNDDIALKVTLNADGNVAVTGISDGNSGLAVINNIVTILYDANGSAAWTKTYAGSGNSNAASDVCFDPDGIVWVAGNVADNTSQSDAVALFIDGVGNQSASLYTGFGDNTENIRAITKDAAGNIYVAGYSVGLNTDRNLCTIKLNASGDTLWSRNISGSMYGSDDDAFALAVDNANNVIVSGYIKNSGTGSDIAIIKYNSTGVQQWLTTYDGVVHESDRSYDMVLDGSGNIYITGKTDIDASIIANDECFTAKYNSSGVLVWSSTYTGGTTGTERGKLVAVSALGNVYSCGRKHNGTDEDIVLIKYNSNGQQQWAVTYNGGNGNDDPNDMELDDLENIYICGTKENGLNTLNTDYITLKYNTAGELQWQQTYNGAGSGADVAEAITLDNAANVIVTGYADSDAGTTVNNDIVTIKYDGNGGQVWLSSYNGINLDDMGDDVSINESGNVFVCGHTNIGSASNINFDIIVYSLSSTGGLDLVTTFALSDSSDVPNKMMWDGSKLYVAGSTWNTQEQRNKLVVKYDVVDAVVESSVSSSELQLWPNPVPNELRMSCSSALSGGSIIIYDAFGKVVYDQPFGNLNSTQIDTSYLMDGVYTFKVISGSQLFSKKFIKVK